MKKRVAAVALSITLCMATVLQTGAASFDDQAGAVSAAAFIDDADSTEAAETGEPDTNQEVPSVTEIPGEITPTPENPITESPVSETPTPAPEVPDTVTPTPDTEPTEAPNDIEIFNAGENSEEPEEVVPSEIPEEVLAAADGKIFASNWVNINGKWKLRKATTNLKAAAFPEEAAAGVPEVTSQEPAEDALLSVPDAETSDTETVAPETSAETMPEEMISDAAAPEENIPEEAVPAEETELNTASAVEYYTAKDGIVHIQTYQSLGQPNTLLTEGDYLFDEDGYMITGQHTVPAGTEGSKYTADKEHFFMDAANAQLKAAGSAAACNPTNSNLGQMQKKYWLWTGKAFRYYSVNGGFVSVASLKKINTAAGKHTGVYTINGAKYILKDNGVPCVGHITLKQGNKPGKYYAQPASSSTDIPGKLFCSGWLRIKDSKGQIMWRKYLSDGRFWNKGIVATKLDKTLDSSVGDDTYLLSAAGYILKNKMVKAANGYYYCTDSNGVIYRGKLVKYKNARYYFANSGYRVSWTNSWHRIASSGNRYYYFGSTPGRVSEKWGWQRVITTSGKSAGWYFFPKGGDHYVNVLTSYGRYFRTDGRLASGITTVNGKTYFFQASTSTTPKGYMYKNTWISYNKKWYYASSTGVLLNNGWQKINGYYYYFNSDYSVKVNSTVTRDGIKGWVDSRGRFYTEGWIIVNNAKNQVQYLDAEVGILKNTSKVINGLKYYFDKDGYRINDLTSMYSGPYYLIADRVNGVMTVYDSTRTVPIKTIRISVGLPGTPTWPTNKDMRLTSYSRWQPLMGPSWGQYGTHVDGAGNGGIFIHSVAGSTQSYYNLPASAYNQLGNPASHGCIRVCVADARWVFYNCNGSTIRIIDGTYNANEAMKGPLGRNALVPLYGSMNFDPTDNLAWH